MKLFLTKVQEETGPLFIPGAQRGFSAKFKPGHSKQLRCVQSLSMGLMSCSLHANTGADSPQLCTLTGTAGLGAPVLV